MLKGIRSLAHWILIIEDDGHISDEVAACLGADGDNLVTAAPGADGYAKLAQYDPWALIVSAETPGAVTEVQHLRDKAGDAPILIICGTAYLDQIIEALDGGAFEFLGRPFSTPALKAALSRMRVVYELKRKLAHPNYKDVSAAMQSDQKGETERFLAVRQIVDNISLFFAQISDNLQSGIKYFNEMPFFVSIHSKEGKVLATNPAYHNYLGNRLDRPSWEIYCGKRATAAACPVGKTLRTEAVNSTRAVVRYASGARVPVVVHTAPIYDNDGEVALVLEVFTGTKEIEQLADEIQTTQQRYQQLFDAVPSRIAVLDRRLRIAAVNRRFQENFGDPDPIRRSFFDVFRPVSFPPYRDPITRTVKDGNPHQGEMVLTHESGTRHNVMVWTAPIHTATGKLIQLVVILADVTELRQLQDNLSSLGLMIGTLSHNLRGTLTGLDAGMYLIERGFYRDKPGRIEEGLDLAKMMAERIRKLVHDILYYSKERPLETEKVEVLGFAGDVAANVENRIRGANIEFQCDLDDAWGEFEIDAALVRSCFLNLLDNAMEACLEDDTKDHHWVAFNAWTEPHAVMFEVSDNGAGMTPAQKQRIFSLFYSSKGRKGTGMGLFIAEKVIRKHGGSITVKSEPGQGTQFSVRLPQKIGKALVDSPGSKLHKA